MVKLAVENMTEKRQISGLDKCEIIAPLKGIKTMECDMLLERNCEKLNSE